MCAQLVGLAFAQHAVQGMSLLVARFPPALVPPPVKLGGMTSPPLFTPGPLANQEMLESIAVDVGEVKDDVREVRSSQQRHLEWHAEQK